MAAPVTHIVLAEKIYNKHFKHKSRKKFFVGTSFPDIQYLGVIDRNKTHSLSASVTDLTSDDSFSVGLKLHSIIDIAREE